MSRCKSSLDPENSRIDTNLYEERAEEDTGDMDEQVYFLLCMWSTYILCICPLFPFSRIGLPRRDVFLFVCVFLLRGLRLFGFGSAVVGGFLFLLGYRVRGAGSEVSVQFVEGFGVDSVDIDLDLLVVRALRIGVMSFNEKHT